MAGLRSHHLTQRGEPWPSFGDRVFAAREASKVLENQRSEWVASDKPSKFIAFLDWVRGKQITILVTELDEGCLVNWRKYLDFEGVGGDYMSARRVRILGFPRRRRKVLRYVPASCYF